MTPKEFFIKGFGDCEDYAIAKYLEEAKGFSSEQILRLMKILFEAENRFKYSSSQKILLEVLLTELCRVNADVVDLSVILSEIEAVKKKPQT